MGARVDVSLPRSNFEQHWLVAQMTIELVGLDRKEQLQKSRQRFAAWQSTDSIILDLEGV